MTEDLEQLTAINPADIRFAAMDLLSRREHSLRELRQKLTRRFGDEDLIEHELQRLVDENLQSDKRFAESFLRQRISRGHGPVRIRQEMRQRGMSDSQIDAALQEEDPNWYDLAQETYRRKYGELSPVDIREKAKRSRFMQYRGFGLEYFRECIQS